MRGCYFSNSNTHLDLLVRCGSFANQVSASCFKLKTELRFSSCHRLSGWFEYQLMSAIPQSACAPRSLYFEALAILILFYLDYFQITPNFSTLIN